MERENDSDDVDMEDCEKNTCESPMIEAFTNTLNSLEKPSFKKVASNTQKSDKRNYLNHSLGRKDSNGKKG